VPVSTLQCLLKLMNAELLRVTLRVIREAEIRRRYHSATVYRKPPMFGYLCKRLISATSVKLVRVFRNH